MVELERRLATTILTGTVDQVDHQARRLRLVIGSDASGGKILSPWVRWAEPGGNGKLQLHVPPKVGALMTLLSPSGTIGEGSVAHWSTYTDANPAPSKAADAAVAKYEGATVTVSPGEIAQTADKRTTSTVGAQSVVVSEKAVLNKGKRVVLDGGQGNNASTSQDEAFKAAVKKKAQADLVASGGKSVNISGNLPSGKSYSYTVTANGS